MAIAAKKVGKSHKYKVMRDDNYRFWDIYSLGGHYPVALAVVVEDSQYNKALRIMMDMLKDVKNGSKKNLSLKFKYALAN